MLHKNKFVPVMFELGNITWHSILRRTETPCILKGSKEPEGSWPSVLCLSGIKQKTYWTRESGRDLHLCFFYWPAYESVNLIIFLSVCLRTRPTGYARFRNFFVDGPNLEVPNKSGPVLFWTSDRQVPDFFGAGKAEPRFFQLRDHFLDQKWN